MFLPTNMNKKLFLLSCLKFTVLLWASVFLMWSCRHDSVIPEPPDPEPEPADTIVSVEGCSGTLPILFINTADSASIDSKETYLQARWWLDSQGLADVESIGSAKAPLELQVKGRGNATWTNLEKKSYRLKLNEKHKMLGMHSSKHWTLQAQAQYWMGQMNDALPFEIGRRMGMSWNPHMEPVELVLNGKYQGLYFLTEKVRVAKHRVNVVEQLDNETDPMKITGGWLLEIDNYIEPGCITFVGGDSIPLWITPHSPEVLSPQQRDYITRFLHETDSAIFIADKEDRTWERYIDIDSLAIYYIVQEIVDNPEAFSGSCYFHKQQGDETKLIFGPLWDCGSSYVRISNNDFTYEFHDFIYENMPSYCRSIWISEIVKFPHFQERVRFFWKYFYEEVYPTIDNYMDLFAARIEQAGNADYLRWPQYSGDNTTARLQSYGKPSLHKKVEWLNAQWGE